MGEFVLGSGTGIGKTIQEATLGDLRSEYFFEPAFSAIPENWEPDPDLLTLEDLREIAQKHADETRAVTRINVRDLQIPGTDLWMENYKLYSTSNPKMYEKFGIRPECIYLYIREKFSDVICMFPDRFFVNISNELTLGNDSTFDHFILYRPNDWNIETADRIYQLIQTCPVRFISVSITMQYTVMRQTMEHAVLMIYDSLDGILYYFNPQGQKDSDFEVRTRRLIHRIADSWGLNDLVFYAPEHPGIQDLSESIGGKIMTLSKKKKKIETYTVDSFPCPKTRGHCDAWSHFILYLVAKNNVSPKVVFAELENIEPEVALETITRFVSFLISIHIKYNCKTSTFSQGIGQTLDNLLPLLKGNEEAAKKVKVYTNESVPTELTWDEVQEISESLDLHGEPRRKQTQFFAVEDDASYVGCSIL